MSRNLETPLSMHQLMVLDYLKDNPESSMKNIKDNVRIREDFHRQDFQSMITELIFEGHIKKDFLNSRKVYTLL